MSAVAPFGPIEIRSERPDHPSVTALLDALDRYLAALYPPEANHILDLDGLRAPGVDVVAAWQDGRVVGCAALRRMPAEPATGDRPYGEIKRMVVDPPARGRGCGAALLAALESLLADEGVPLARLETGRDQHEAVRLYRRAGYRECAPFGGYPDNGLSLFLGKTVRAPAVGVEDHA